MPLAALAVAVAAPLAAVGPRDWRQVASQHDRQRLRDWRSAWMAALDEVHAGDRAGPVAADRTLYAADAGLVDGAMPPAGDYRCRRIVMGARAGVTAPAAGDWGRCRIDGAAPPLRLVALDGGQRAAGSIYADSDRRAVFLGTVMFAGERRPADYGHAAGRDMAGVVERIGDRRWRLALPYPPFGAALDLIEMVPADL